MSSLGKGVGASSIASLLSLSGHKVDIVKLDPYLNIDPGTMNPVEHGEVFVTEDGAETDLDLGHYERMLGRSMKSTNNFTSGQVWNEVLLGERRGDFAGQTVQVVPHIINEIHRRIHEHYAKSDLDLLILEIGGTVGDIESLPFLEAVRQLTNPFETDVQVGLMHVSLLPWLRKSGELKTKAAQHSIAELRSHGLTPDFLACRTELAMEDRHVQKLARYALLSQDRVFAFPDVNHIYELPLLLDQQKISQVIQEFFGLEVRDPERGYWEKIVARLQKARNTSPLRIALIGKYSNSRDSDEMGDAYKSLVEALRDCSTLEGRHAEIKFIAADKLNSGSQQAIFEQLDSCAGAVIPGGFGRRGFEGMITAARYCREKGIPTLGICLGMQVMAVEALRNIAGMSDASSTEIDANTPHPVISLVAEWDDLHKGHQERQSKGDLGGTLRLGAQTVHLTAGSRASGYYGKLQVQERHRHRYEVHPEYVSKLEEAGFYRSATTSSERSGLSEVFERREDAFYIGCQYHPEFTCGPEKGHPLISAFVRAALKNEVGEPAA